MKALTFAPLLLLLLLQQQLPLALSYLPSFSTRAAPLRGPASPKSFVRPPSVGYRRTCANKCTNNRPVTELSSSSSPQGSGGSALDDMPLKTALYNQRWIQLALISILALISDWVCFSTASSPKVFEGVYGERRRPNLAVFARVVFQRPVLLRIVASDAALRGFVVPKNWFLVSVQFSLKIFLFRFDAGSRTEAHSNGDSAPLSAKDLPSERTILTPVFSITARRSRSVRINRFIPLLQRAVVFLCDRRSVKVWHGEKHQVFGPRYARRMSVEGRRWRLEWWQRAGLCICCSWLVL